MAFSDNKITVADLTGKGVTGMADTPNLTTAQMQQKLDEIAKEVIPPKFNALCDDLDATDFASIITSKSTDKMLFQRLNEYDQIEYSVDNVNWFLVASGKEVLDPTLEADNAKKLGGQLPSYYQKATDDTLTTTDKTTTGAIIEIKTGLDNVDTTANEAPPYSPTSTYTLGKYVSHEKHIYECTTAIEVAEEWNATHWTQTTLGEEIETVNNSLSLIGDLSTFTNTTYPTLASLLNFWESRGKITNPNYVALIPKMTSNTLPSGVASAETGTEAYKAFDNDDLTYWGSSNGTSSWLQYKFTGAVVANKMSVLPLLSTYIRMKNFTLKGSNDGTNFTDIYTGIYDNPNEAINMDYTFENNTAYLYYRLVIIDRYNVETAGSIAISSFQLYSHT